MEITGEVYGTSKSSYSVQNKNRGLESQGDVFRSRWQMDGKAEMRPRAKSQLQGYLQRSVLKGLEAPTFSWFALVTPYTYN